MWAVPKGERVFMFRACRRLNIEDASRYLTGAVLCDLSRYRRLICSGKSREISWIFFTHLEGGDHSSRQGLGMQARAIFDVSEA
jgi:hypothetical protein